MKKALKARWVAALRSGKFKQTAEALKKEEEDGTVGHCCLGVLCEVSPAVAKRTDSAGPYLGGWTQQGYLPGEALAYAGFDEATMIELTMKNDSGLSFKRIATYIEKNL
jgi:hypothetical protein